MGRARRRSSDGSHAADQSASGREVSVMNSKSGRVIVASCVLLGLAGCVAYVLIPGGAGGGVGAGAQQEAVPRLFSDGYQAGHDLAGFSGRPMVLVFGDSRTPGWSNFLAACESDPNVAALLKEKFTGVFVDAAKDSSAFETYGVKSPGVLLVKDLRGPLLGVLEGEFTCEDLLVTLDGIVPHLDVQRSPLYDRLLRSEETLADLVANGERNLAAQVVKHMKRLEPNTQGLSRVEAKAAELGLEE